jgi:predicted nuclease of predicted toxin-antitoxin system
MAHRFHKHKLLLDENMSSRLKFPRLNGLFDVKHIRDDLNQSGIPDKEVYMLAVALKRLIVTFNAKDFKHLASASLSSGVIAVSPHLSSHQIDTKLTALLVKTSEKALAGKFTPLREEA